ncbi:MAG: carboxypeptidase-like regulatory domain-containing protein [Candidatus Solibacter sp.]|nr:carboxypeptidase-like regulatory domain-containing protein [Candidatus Solibacter sp.]
MKHNIIAAACLMVVLLVAPVSAQSDRVTITGTVADPASAFVPGAKVTAVNTETGAVYETASTPTGNYTLPSLPKGSYDLSAQAAGFSRSIQKGIQVQVAQTIRIDVVLQVGATSESVTVTAQASLIRTENAEQSINVIGDRVNALPMNFGGGGNSTGQMRNWLSFVVLSPGVSGTDEYASVNNSPVNSFKIYLEGQDVTSSNDVGWQSSVAAASVETIGEFSVQSSNCAAEFGQINGGLFNFTIKSGTNQLHGSAYEYLTNEAFDAGTPFTKAKPRSRKNDFGFSLGGPVYLPKLYNGRDKTFFFFNIEWFRNKTMTAGYYSTVPTAAYRNGDFSAALTGRQLTTTLDPLGRTIVENVVYDPGTSRPMSGTVVRDPFPGNKIPVSHFDPVAVKIQNLIPAPDNSGLINNWQQVYPGYRFQSVPGFKIDHSFSPNTKLAFYYSKEDTNLLG